MHTTSAAFRINQFLFVLCTDSSLVTHLYETWVSHMRQAMASSQASLAQQVKVVCTNAGV